MNPFELAKQKRLEQQEAEKRQEEEKKSKSYSTDYEEIKWMGLTQEPKGFRIVGFPAEVREKPADAKIFYWSKIVNDTHKQFVHLYWPTTPDDELDKEWIFHRLYSKIMESEWIDYKEGETRDPNKPKSNEKGYFLDKYVGTPSHTRLDKNKKDGSNQFGHVYPKKRIGLNVIDRMDDWCKENSHCKLLSSSHTPFDITTDKGEKKTIYFTDKGVPFEFYKLLFSQVLEFRGTWDLDLVTHKEEKKYVLRDGMEDKIRENVKKLINIDPITEEEKQYGLYNLDDIFKPTGYYKLYNGFEKLFKQADLDLGTKFHSELVELYEVEKLEREKEKKENETKGESQSTTGGYESKPESEPEEELEKVEEPKASSENTRRKPPEEKSESVKDKLSKLPKWSSLTETDKASMESNCISLEGESFKYKENTSLIPCDCEKKINFPDDVFHCPICSKEFS